MLQKEKWKVVETLTVHAIGSYKVGLVVKGEGRATLSFPIIDTASDMVGLSAGLS